MKITLLLFRIIVKPDDQATPSTFYGMKEGEENDVRIKFRANPKPNMGQWKIGDISVPVGAADVENKFQSSQIIDGVSLLKL